MDDPLCFHTADKDNIIHVNLAWNTEAQERMQRELLTVIVLAMHKPNPKQILITYKGEDSDGEPRVCDFEWSMDRKHEIMVEILLTIAMLRGSPNSRTVIVKILMPMQKEVVKYRNAFDAYHTLAVEDDIQGHLATKYYATLQHEATGKVNERIVTRKMNGDHSLSNRQIAVKEIEEEYAREMQELRAQPDLYQALKRHHRTAMYLFDKQKASSA